MKYLFIFIAVFMMYSCKPAEYIYSPQHQVKLYPVGANNLWGYADESGKRVIDYQFQEVNFFSSGMAVVKQKDKYGYIDEQGEFIIKPKFDSAESMRHNGAYVSRNGKNIPIDRKGNRIRKNLSSFGSQGYCGLPLYATNPSIFFDETDFGYSLKSQYLDQLKYYEPTANHIADDFTFDEVIPFSNVSVVVRKNNKFGFYVHHNHVGLSSLWVDEIIFEPSQNTEVDKQKYHGTAIIRVDGKWGVIQSMGKLMIEPEFLSLENIWGNIYLAEYEADKFGCVSLGNKRYY